MVTRFAAIRRGVAAFFVARFVLVRFLVVRFFVAVAMVLLLFSGFPAYAEGSTKSDRF